MEGDAWFLEDLPSAQALARYAEERYADFGPFFTERALTAGKGKFSFGANYVRTTFDAFEGENLRDGCAPDAVRNSVVLAC